MQCHNMDSLYGCRFWQNEGSSVKSARNNIILVYFHTMEYSHLCMDMDYGVWNVPYGLSYSITLWIECLSNALEVSTTIRKTRKRMTTANTWREATTVGISAYPSKMAIDILSNIYTCHLCPNASFQAHVIRYPEVDWMPDNWEKWMFE